MIDSSLQKEAHYDTKLPNFRPFTIGNISPEKGFIHVLDDTTLSIVLNTLDTISDFVEYLEKKERFFLSNKVKMLAAGEEDLLAYYLQKMNKDKEHDFVVPAKMDIVFLEEGFWNDFCSSEERVSQVIEDRVSYAWDRLIEHFTQHIIEGTQYHTNSSDIQEAERFLRFMARERRTRRRILASAFIEIIENTPKNTKYSRVLLPSKSGDPHYVFLILPRFENIPESEYREVRSELLHAYCLVTKLRFPNALDIVGIATEAAYYEVHSEDATYFDGRTWNDELREEALSLQEDLGILTNTSTHYSTVLDYPSERKKIEKGPYKRSKFAMKGNARNSPCICGSGRKFKHCCGSKS